jgi:transcription attenuation protein (tryptophan RNA-binding attenuator protein)
MIVLVSFFTIREKICKQAGAKMNQKNDHVVIKAMEDGVNVIGLTRGSDTRFHHSEKLDKGEVMIAQFTEHTSAIKIRGKAQIQTSVGELESDSRK